MKRDYALCNCCMILPSFGRPSLPKLGKIIHFSRVFLLEFDAFSSCFSLFVTHFWEQNHITQSREPSYYCFGNSKKNEQKNAKITTKFWEPPFLFFQNCNPVLGSNFRKNVSTRTQWYALASTATDSSPVFKF